MKHWSFFSVTYEDNNSPAFQKMAKRLQSDPEFSHKSQVALSFEIVGKRDIFSSEVSIQL
jgi:L-ribulose-5-phosphate 3-epimerase UlaE